MNTNLWGNYSIEFSPEERYDPLQSWISDKVKIGYRVHIVPTRGSRPRDNKSRIEDHSNEPSSNLFSSISEGKATSIVISTDDKVRGNYTDQPDYHTLSEHRGITIINKYSPLNHNGSPALGVALVSYSNYYSEDLSNKNANESILFSMKTAIEHMLGGENTKFNTSLIFFNIGPNSGASLKQLHSQTYILPSNTGLIHFATEKAYIYGLNELKECLTCGLSRSKSFTDHLEQVHQLELRTLWEDENFRVITPFAPIRSLSTRILPKRHVNVFSKLTRKELNSLAYALKVGDEAINLATPSQWPSLKGRTVAFRQSRSINDDFHFFIDVLPSIPFGGSELVDSLSITTLLPEKTAQIVRKKMKSF